MVLKIALREPPNSWRHCFAKAYLVPLFGSPEVKTPFLKRKRGVAEHLLSRSGLEPAFEFFIPDQFNLQHLRRSFLVSFWGEHAFDVRRKFI